MYKTGSGNIQDWPEILLARKYGGYQRSRSHGNGIRNEFNRTPSGQGWDN